jgi:hypothetical protein
MGIVLDLVVAIPSKRKVVVMMVLIAVLGESLVR